MESKKELLKIIRTARMKLNRIEGKESFEENNKLLGKCFKYRNSYGGECKGWWLYQKVIKVESEGSAYLFRFQDDKNGRIEIQPKHFSMLRNIGERITEKQFNTQWEKLKKKLEGMG